MKTEVNFEEMEAFYNDLLEVQKEHLPDCTIGSFLIGFLNYVSLNCRRPDFIDNEALRMCLPAYAAQLEDDLLEKVSSYANDKVLEIKEDSNED